MDQTVDSNEAADGGVRRACDQCRARKIRCDKESPCSNCRTANRSCSSTGQRHREARQRVLISTQYERKIDQFEARLRGIEGLLQNISVSLDSRAGEPAHHPHPSSHGSGDSRDITPSTFDDGSSTVYDAGRDDPHSAFEGTSSLAAQTVLASEFLDHAVERTSLKEMSSEMRSALSSLQQIVRMQQQKSFEQEARFPNQIPIPRGGVRELPMPPQDVILREMNDMRSGALNIVGTFMAVEDFTDHCRKVYFATEDFSLVTFIIVNCGLYYLFQAKHIMDDNEAAASDFLRYQLICRDNLETALANLPLFMPATAHSIQALLLGATYAVENSKPSLAWPLTCTAAQLCMTRGYHRQPSSDVADDNSTLFWFAYMLDKGLALRLGRSPTINDHDISKPRTVGGTCVSNPWRDVLNIWIAHAEIQGLAYEQLYSAAALAGPPDRRAESARQLAARLGDIAARRALVRDRFAAGIADSREVPGSSVVGIMPVNLFLKSDEVLFWSSTALVYRAVPAAPGQPSSLSAECIDAARAAFRSHQEFLELAGTSSTVVKITYLHWTILYAPFVPFIVIFCHVIETSDADDLQRLAEFVASLRGSCGASEPIDKLYRLCQVLHNVAALYVKAKAKQQQDHDMALIGNDFDMYLSQLGLVPQVDVPNSGIDGEMAAASNLSDWFSGGRDMMDLLETDLSMFHPEPWPPDMGGAGNP